MHGYFTERPPHPPIWQPRLSGLSLVAVEGSETERVNRVCAHTKRQGPMCQHVSLGPLKRLKFNWSTSLGAGLSTNAQRPTSPFDGYLPTCATRTHTPKKIEYTFQLLEYHCNDNFQSSCPAENKTFYTCLILLNFKFKCPVLHRFNRWMVEGRHLDTTENDVQKSLITLCGGQRAGLQQMAT